MSQEEFGPAGEEREEQARRRAASRPPKDLTPVYSYPTYERILVQAGELDLQSQLRLLEELAVFVRGEAGKDIVRTIS